MKEVFREFFFVLHFCIFAPKCILWVLIGIALLTLKLPVTTFNCHLLCHLLVILKAIFATSVDPDQTADQGSHCLPVCKNRFEKFARIFSS